ncbi:universal stress PHOS32-like [Olea europaea subsp. europaea]|uniref:Universal stress PHOS32-like n=1 Tax=Olea europaea subsp. europaea TaxID=158383 RepID=A0A8S0QTJ0_OLEEU|nr:universal stress PHOS32-like [Olea europaea subsp. europaea]
MPGLWMSRAAVCVRACVRVRSPTVQYKKSASFIEGREKSDASSEVINEPNFNNYLSKLESECGNRVMVVIDSSPESKGALEWALSHTVQAQDTIILLHVAKQDENYNGEINQRAYELLHSMNNVCQLRRPEVHVEMAIREGKEKGEIIVEEAKQRQVLLLVLGQRKRSIIWRLQRFLSAELKKKNRIVDYCIQNANCMTIAVRRKSKKYGGYLITTKSHKKFWLLA